MATDRKEPQRISDDELDQAKGGTGSSPITGRVIIQGKHLPAFDTAADGKDLKNSTGTNAAAAEELTMNFQKVQIAYVPPDES